MSDDLCPDTPGNREETKPAAAAPDPSSYCPNCGTQMRESRCKMVCKNCGFFLSCSDFYWRSTQRSAIELRFCAVQSTKPISCHPEPARPTQEGGRRRRTPKWFSHHAVSGSFHEKYWKTRHAGSVWWELPESAFMG